MMWVAVVTAAMLAVTFGWIAADALRSKRRSFGSPLHYRPVTVVPCPRDPAAEALEAYVSTRVEELESIKRETGTIRRSELKRSRDYSVGSDTQIVKAIDMKIEIAKSIAHGVKKKS